MLHQQYNVFQKVWFDDNNTSYIFLCVQRTIIDNCLLYGNSAQKGRSIIMYKTIMTLSKLNKINGINGFLDISILWMDILYAKNDKHTLIL